MRSQALYRAAQHMLAQWRQQGYVQACKAQEVDQHDGSQRPMTQQGSSMTMIWGALDMPKHPSCEDAATSHGTRSHAMADLSPNTVTHWRPIKFYTIQNK